LPGPHQASGIYAWFRPGLVLHRRRYRAALAQGISGGRALTIRHGRTSGQTATLLRKLSISARRLPTEVSTDCDAVSTVPAAARVPMAASETLPSAETTRLVPLVAFTALREISEVAALCCRIEAAALAARVEISFMLCSMPCTASTAPPVDCCTARM